MKIPQEIKEALASIRPYLNADGGDIKVIDITENTLKIELMGACSSCPMSAMTMKAGVEEAVKHAAPYIKKVEAVNV